MKIQRENVKRKGKEPKGKFSSRFPLLAQRAKEWGFEIPTNQPIGTKCMIWRLPPVHEHRVPGTDITLVIPDEHDSPHVKGVLVSAGMKALEVLESEGITLGHIVQWKRYAGDEMQDHTEEALKGQRFVWVERPDIVASDDLRQALENGRADYVKGMDGKMNLRVTGDIPGARLSLPEMKQAKKAPKALSARKKKLLALAADPSASKSERATARRIAARQ